VLEDPKCVPNASIQISAERPEKFAVIRSKVCRFNRNVPDFSDLSCQHCRKVPHPLHSSRRAAEIWSRARLASSHTNRFQMTKYYVQTGFHSAATIGLSKRNKKARRTRHHLGNSLRLLLYSSLSRRLSGRGIFLTRRRRPVGPRRLGSVEHGSVV